MVKDILKVATITPKLSVAKPKENKEEIIKLLKEIKADIVVFPELSLTGYTAGDYLFEQELLKESLDSLNEIVKLNYKGVVVVGMPISLGGTIFNCAVVINNGLIKGVVPKAHLSNMENYNEDRYFTSGLNVNFDSINLLNKEVPFGNILFNNNDITFGIEIGTDMYVPITKGAIMSTHGANLIINTAASFDYVDKHKKRLNIINEHSRKNVGAYVYVSSGITESTSYVLFSGDNVVSVLGEVINRKQFKSLESKIMLTDIDLGKVNFKRMKNDNIKKTIYTINETYKNVEVSFPYEINNGFSNPINKTPLLLEDSIDVFNQIRDIQHFSLEKRLAVLNNPKVVFGLSGGLDSSYALLVLVDSFKRSNKDLKDIIAVSLPGNHTTDESKKYAFEMAKKLNISFKEIDITEEVNLHFKMIEQDEKEQNITYENVQARIRTQTLMNLANKYNGIVIGTNNLSEIALGFMTYNADMMSMYAINSGLPKTLLHRQFDRYKEIFPEIAELIEAVSNRLYSPELKGEQETEEIVGSYEINDFLIYRKLACGDSSDKMIFIVKEAFNLTKEEASNYVKRFQRLFKNNQFKRQVIPDGPQILSISLSAKTGFLAGGDV